MKIIDDKRFIRSFIRDVCGQLIPHAELHLWSLEAHDNHEVLMLRADEPWVRIIPATQFHGWDSLMSAIPFEDLSTIHPRAQELISRFVAKHKLKLMTQLKKEA